MLGVFKDNEGERAPSSRVVCLMCRRSICFKAATSTEGTPARTSQTWEVSTTTPAPQEESHSSHGNSSTLAAEDFPARRFFANNRGLYITEPMDEETARAKARNLMAGSGERLSRVASGPNPKALQPKTISSQAKQPTIEIRGLCDSIANSLKHRGEALGLEPPRFHLFARLAQDSLDSGRLEQELRRFQRDHTNKVAHEARMVAVHSYTSSAAYLHIHRHSLMCICRCICVCIGMYVCMYVCLYVCMHVYMCVCMYACTYVYMCVWVYVCVCMNERMYVCVCMHACMCV